MEVGWIWVELESINIVKTHCQKFAKNLYDTRCFIKEDIRKAKKHLKRISTSLAQGKDRSKYVSPLAHVRVAKVNITDPNQVQVVRWSNSELQMEVQTAAASLENCLKVPYQVRMHFNMIYQFHNQRFTAESCNPMSIPNPWYEYP